MEQTHLTARERDTVFSPDRRYRYTLWRQWNQAPDVRDPLGRRYVQFIGLNPSTADETQDDPTVRRCMGYAKAWGYRAMCMTNIFAFRATDPRVMKGQSDPVGPDNDAWLTWIAHEASVIVACWGAHGSYLGRDAQVWKLLDGLQCLAVTKDGSPAHPLYLPKHLTPIDYDPPERF